MAKGGGKEELSEVHSRKQDYSFGDVKSPMSGPKELGQQDRREGDDPPL